MLENLEDLLDEDQIQLLASIEKEAGGDKTKAKELLLIQQIENMLNKMNDIDLYTKQIQTRLEMLRFLIKKEDS